MPVNGPLRRSERGASQDRPLTTSASVTLRPPNPRALRRSLIRLRLRARTHQVARPEGLEPPTSGLEGRCSIHLSYGRISTPPSPRARPEVRTGASVGPRTPGHLSYGRL